ncbi:ADP-ribosylglycohydrolase family protein [Singulisphaera acidiphila]|uniref:ADP-ribosylglycohydrolase n=1 Tax=Singulisphaera acidiphila (strain ATCC BAA-1392 / DSM 18658 / VKM B-2454 / MOB10) TaxID=886293 RepID=L0DIU9_SINAD|nr:ADP-ribosylglycohydrolase family protein [Singulisphaera acidiphila]AGA28775.1 ADP-ribosylglycohydrolase [Singulisphaera acidiphila DSM 18658]
MLGAIAGDIIGSIYERNNIKTTEFPLFQPSCRFTDDTVLTVALADSILNGIPYVDLLKRYYRAYPHAGYGGSFHKWAQSKGTEPYNSWGNGSAMRVSPVGLAYETLETVLEEAKKSAEVTHNHPEGIKGAQAIASAVFLARTGQSHEQIKNYVEAEFGYHLDTPLDEIRKTYVFQISCQESVPQAIRAFLESTDFEDAVRRAISIGGDSDTIACMAGAIAEAREGGIPAPIRRKVYEILDESLCRTTREFVRKYSRS